MPELTERLIRLAAPQTRRRMLWDSKISGFGVRILPSGTKTFCYCYVNLSGIQRRLNLGRLGVISCAEARERAKRAALAVLEGRDPATARLQLIAGPTVGDLVENYLDHCQKRVALGALRAASVAHYRGALQRYVLPALGAMKVTDVSEDDLFRLIMPIVRDRPRSAEMVVSLLRLVFFRAERLQIIPLGTSPAGGIHLPQKRRRARAPTREEVGRLGEAFREVERRSLAWWKLVQLFRLLALTGRRVSELTCAAKGWVDLDARTLRVPAAFAKVGEAHYHIPAPAVPVLRSVIDTFPKSPWLFPNRLQHQHISSVATRWRIVRHEAGLDWMTPRHLRHLYASAGRSLGLDLATLGRLLGHARASSTDIYVHWYRDSYIEAAESTSGRVAAWLDRSMAASRDQ